MLFSIRTKKLHNTYKAEKNLKKKLKIKDRLKHTQLNLCEKAELSCFLYLIQSFAEGDIG